MTDKKQYAADVLTATEGTPGPFGCSHFVALWAKILII
jgi:hypothetical protein